LDRHVDRHSLSGGRPIETRALALLDAFADHWLLLLNGALAAFVLGAGLAPLLAMAGATDLADGLYAVYHAACHQWAFRSFFLFGPQAVYGRDQLQALGVDPFGFVGGPNYGWKLAFCERDLAIYLSLLGFGLAYAHWRGAVRPAGFFLYALLALPMALDGFTQLFGWRESTWLLRVLTGLLFGAASGWLLLPRFDASLAPGPRRYPPAEAACTAPPPLSPEG
jgi:uncharacterized membrane protein